jgi:hypothetical protein
LAKKDSKPVLTKWKGEPMIRVHSIQAAARQIMNATKSIDVVKIGIVGEPSTGKTELAKTLAHLFHKISTEEGRENYAVRSFVREDFMNIEHTFGSLAPTNYIMRFQDLSFLGAGANRKEIEQVKKTITEIRHLKNQKDVKVILIYDYHYTKALDKYLRQAHFRFFTSLGSEEAENMAKIVGSRYFHRIEQFKRMQTEILKRQKASFLIKKKWFTYSYKNPFVPILFYDEDSLRFVVFPLREWIQPICAVCSNADNTKVESELSLPDFIKKIELVYPKQNILSALKLKLFVNGINTYSKQISSVSKFLDKVLEARTINLEDLAVAYGLTVTRTKLRKKLDQVLD